MGGALLRRGAAYICCRSISAIISILSILKLISHMGLYEAYFGMRSSFGASRTSLLPKHCTYSVVAVPVPWLSAKVEWFFLWLVFREDNLTAGSSFGVRYTIIIHRETDCKRPRRSRKHEGEPQLN